MSHLTTQGQHSAKDNLAPPVMGRYLAATIPNCRATFYPDEGHSLLGEHAREVLAALVPSPAPAAIAASSPEPSATPEQPAHAHKTRDRQ